MTPENSALRRQGCGAPRADGKMAVAGGPAGKGRDISLAALRRHDPYISRIVDVASQVALYTFGHRANEWVRAGGRGRGEGGGGASGDDPPAVPRSGDPDLQSPGPSRGVDQTHGARTGLSPAERVGHLPRHVPAGREESPDGTQPGAFPSPRHLSPQPVITVPPKATHKSENTKKWVLTRERREQLCSKFVTEETHRKGQEWRDAGTPVPRGPGGGSGLCAPCFRGSVSPVFV